MRWQFVALCLEVLALIFVPSSATVPSFTKPIFRASRTTSTNSLENVSRCCWRKRLTPRKPGRLPAASSRGATSPASLAAILRGAPARGKQARGAGPDRRFGEHRRVAGLMAPVVALAAEVEGAQVELIDGVGDEIGQMIFGQPIARRRRRQERLLGLMGPLARISLVCHSVQNIPLLFRFPRGPDSWRSHLWQPLFV